MNIIIFGPQASGKGTQAELLVKKLGLKHFEMGAFLRGLASKDIYLDQKINKKGELLPDGKTNKYASLYLETFQKYNNFLFDGFPRSKVQYEFLRERLNEGGEKVDLAILLDISERTTIERLMSRRVCVKCGTNYNLITNPPPGGKCECGGKLIQRVDDKPEAIKVRLAAYKERTKPMIDVFKKEGILVKVDGERPIDVIFKDILSKIKEKSGVIN